MEDSYQNGENDHTLHSCYPSVELGFKTVEMPSNVIYLPVNVQGISNITLSVVDQIQWIFAEKLSPHVFT